MFQNLWRRNCKKNEQPFSGPLREDFFSGRQMKNATSSATAMKTTWQRTPISILSRVMPEKTTKSVKSQNKAMLSSHVTSWHTFLQIFPVYQKYVIPYLQHDWMGCHLTVNLTTSPKKQFNLSPNMFWQDHTGQSNLHTKTKMAAHYVIVLWDGVAGKG